MFGDICWQLFSQKLTRGKGNIPHLVNVEIPLSTNLPTNGKTGP
jgi:hypothetical protein